MAKPPTEMTVIEITEPGGPEVLRPAHRPVPAPGLGEVLIEVTAAGVNRPDTMQRPGPLSATARRLGHSGTSRSRATWSRAGPARTATRLVPPSAR